MVSSVPPPGWAAVRGRRSNKQGRARTGGAQAARRGGETLGRRARAGDTGERARLELERDAAESAESRTCRRGRVPACVGWLAGEERPVVGNELNLQLSKFELEGGAQPRLTAITPATLARFVMLS